MGDSLVVYIRYSKYNKPKINNWIDELSTSKEIQLQNNIATTIKFKALRLRSWVLDSILVLLHNNATDNNEINKDPASILIDKRLDSVKDWEKLEKDSNK